METMRRLQDEGRTILIASHDPLVYASDLAESIIEMRDGSIVGAPEES
jgi:putative ABC transport system ATP-binding protein